jgi:glutamyl-tRNA synthetase
LRIEDTDRKRSEDAYTDAILDSLSWLGITWDEGPYFQSERLDLYTAASRKLLDSAAAYWDEDPEKGRALKMKMPDEIIEVSDLIHGTVEFDASLADDFVIIKSDGYPSYNFACVVDDVEMGITHVIRGDEHLSNMPRQLTIYRALGLEPPPFAHIPMILGPDGSKLSKRHGAASVGEYRKNGFIPEALVNFVALLGWSPGDDTEIMSLEDMRRRFDLSRVRKVPSQFDNTKLLWMNGQYIMDLPLDRLAAEVRDYLSLKGVDVTGFSDEWMATFIDAYRQRMKTLDDAYAASSFIFGDDLEYDPAVVSKILGRDGAMDTLADVRSVLAAQREWSVDALETALRGYCEEKGLGLGKVAQPVRVAVTGTNVSPPIFEVLVLIGRERALARIDRVLQGGAARPGPGEGAGVR